MSDNTKAAACGDGKRLSDFYALVYLTRLLAGQVLNINIGDAHQGTEVDDSEGGNDVASELSDMSNEAEIDHMSLRTNLTLIEGTDDWKRLFLDRFAEAASKNKGGLYVTNAAMLFSGAGMRLFVTCNTRFDDESIDFFRKIEACMRAIAKEGDEHDSNSKIQLWEALLEHQRDQIEHCYIPYVRQGLEAFFEDDTSQSSEPGRKEPHRVLSILHDHLAPSQGISRIAFHSTPIIEALRIRRLAPVRDYLTSTAKSSKLWLHICFLARIRAAYERFTQMVTSNPAFGAVTITPVTIDDPQ